MNATQKGARQVQRFIRCRKTLRYFNGEGWTLDPKGARSFAHVIDAARVCVDRGLIDVELVLHLSEAHSELFSTPIR